METRQLSKIGFKPKWNKEGLSEEIKFHLTNGILGWGNYYVDSLMENAEEFLEGNRNLCTHGGDDTVILNMNEFIKLVLKHRLDIEMELRKNESRAVKLTNDCGIEFNLILNEDEIKQYEKNGFRVVEELNKSELKMRNCQEQSLICPICKGVFSRDKNHTCTCYKIKSRF